MDTEIINKPTVITKARIGSNPEPESDIQTAERPQVQPGPTEKKLFTGEAERIIITSSPRAIDQIAGIKPRSVIIYTELYFPVIITSFKRISILKVEICVLGDIDTAWHHYIGIRCDT